MTSHIEVPPPDQETIESACLSYRHDFGLLDGGLQSAVRAVARRWLSAWRSGYSAGGQPPGPRGLGDGDAEPFARTIDAACVSFDPAFRTRPFHDASALRRDGIGWLRAWRKAFEDEGLPTAADVRGIMAAGLVHDDASPLDRAEASLGKAAQAAVDLLALIDREPARIATLCEAAGEAVSLLERMVVHVLQSARLANPDQPFVDYRAISEALSLDRDTVLAVLARLKRRRAILFKWDFDGGVEGVIVEAGGYASREGVDHDGT